MLPAPFSTAVLLVAMISLMLVGAIAAEVLAPRGPIPIRSRIGGTFLQLTFNASLVLATYPLNLIYGSLGLRPILPPLEQWAGWLALPIALLAADFLRYWEHRFEHRFMWPIHAVHHSPTELHAANTYGHPLQAIPGFFLMAVPLSLLNLGGAIPAAIAAILTFLTIFIHASTSIHFGPLRHVLVDNRYHRIHHSMEPRHFNRNFGIVFSFWDRLFGTAHMPADDEWPEVGVKEYPPPKTLRQLFAMPFRAWYRSGLRWRASPPRYRSSE